MKWQGEVGRRDRFWSNELMPMMTSVLLICTGNALQTTVVSLELTRAKTSSSAIELILTGFPAGFLVGCLLAQWVVSKLGHQLTFRLAGLVAALAAFAFALTGNEIGLFGIRAVNGAAMAVIFITCESWINMYASPASRGARFSLYMVATSLGVLLGQIVAGVGAQTGGTLFAVAAVIVASGVFHSRFATSGWPTLPLAVPTIELPLGGSKLIAGLKQLVLVAPVAIIAIMQAGTTNMNFYALMPLYGDYVGLTTTTTVALISTFTVGGLLAQPAIGWISDRMDRGFVLAWQGLLVAALCGAIAWLGNQQLPLLYVLFFLYGGISLTLYPVAIAYASSRIQGTMLVSAASNLLLLYSISNMATPSFATHLLSQFGPPVLFAIFGGGALILAVAAGLTYRLQPRLVDPEV